MILWFVRLRRASKHGIYHTALLEAERLGGPCKRVTDPIKAIKQADPADYVEFLKNEEAPILETVSDKEDDMANLELTESEESEEDLYETYRKEKAKLRSEKAKREFFTGIKFQLRLDSIQVNVNSICRQIVRNAEAYPNLHFVINNCCLKLLFNNEDLAVQFTMKEIMLFDYFRNEKSQDVVGYIGTELVDTDGDGEDFKTIKYKNENPAEKEPGHTNTQPEQMFSPAIKGDKANSFLSPGDGRKSPFMAGRSGRMTAAGGRMTVAGGRQTA